MAIKYKNSCSKGEYNFYSKIESELNIVIDAGAADTFFDCLECEVHFFEPDSKHYNSLVNNKSGNEKHFYNKVGLGNTITKKMLYNELGSVINWDCTKLGIRKKNINVVEEIEIIRLEDYLDNNHIQSISLLKVDVEGMDYEVIEGLGRYINKCKYITFEFQGHIAEWNLDGAKESFNRYLKILENYNVFNINHDGSISTITDNMMAGYHNFVAINKNF